MSTERPGPSDDPGFPAGSGREFSDVDAAADPTRLVSYLDHVAGQVRDLKRRGYAHLDLKAGAAVLDVGCGPGTDVFGLEAIVGPAGRAAGVDVSTDGGATWHPAQLEPGDPQVWTRWSFDWDDPPRGERVLMARATDAAGRTQPMVATPNDEGYFFDAVVQHPVTVA